MSSNNTTLPMSKEVDIDVFLKSDNNESHQKRLFCAVLYIKFHLQRPEVGKNEFSLVKAYLKETKCLWEKFLRF